MPGNRHTEEVRAVDMEVGGDDDMPGIAQELTTDDIDDIAFDPNLTVGERRERLMELRDELVMRRVGRLSRGDMEGLSRSSRRPACRARQSAGERDRAGVDGHVSRRPER